MRSHLRAGLPLAVILALAAALRLLAIGFGLPYPHARPDEETAVGHAAAILAGDLNPHFFNWPSLALYVFAASLAAARAAGATLTAGHEILIARVVVAAAGTATVLVLAALVHRMSGRRTAIVAALFLAVAPLHVRESHFALTDVLMTLLLTIALSLAVRGRFTAAGAAGGLATSTKYSAGAIVAVAAAAPSIGGALLFLAAWAAAFVAGTPFAIADWPAFTTDVAFERAHLGAGHTVQLLRGWLYHPLVTLPHGLGIPLSIAALAGVPMLFVRDRRHAVLAIFAAAFYLSIGSGRTVFFRYALPLVPVACVCAALAVARAASWLAPRLRLADAWIVAVLAILVATPSLVQSIRLDRLLARQDSRVIAAAWLAERLQPASTLHDSGGDYTRLALDAVDFHAWRYDAAAATFGDPRGATPDWIVLYQSPLDEYTSAPASLVDLVRTRYELAVRVPGVPAERGSGVYDRQDAFFLPIDGFKGVARPGPTVLIYRRR